MGSKAIGQPNYTEGRHGNFTCNSVIDLCYGIIQRLLYWLHLPCSYPFPLCVIESHIEEAFVEQPNLSR